MDKYEIYIHKSYSRPKWDDKIIQPVGDIARNPLDPRKTRSQFHNASFASEIDLAENFYMIIGSDQQSYQEYFHHPWWKSSMQDEFTSLQENEKWMISSLSFQEEACAM